MHHLQAQGPVLQWRGGGAASLGRGGTAGSFCAPMPRTACCSPSRARNLQFSSSKWLPGGKAGASELAQALDLGLALMMLHMDLQSLQVGIVLAAWPALSHAPFLLRSAECAGRGAAVAAQHGLGVPSGRVCAVLGCFGLGYGPGTDAAAAAAAAPGLGVPSGRQRKQRQQ